MHVGMTAIFQNPLRSEGVSDYEVYKQDMELAFQAETLGFESVWGVEHHFTDYTMTPDVTQFLAAVGGACKKVKNTNSLKFIAFIWLSPSFFQLL